MEDFEIPKSDESALERFRRLTKGEALEMIMDSTRSSRKIETIGGFLYESPQFGDKTEGIIPIDPKYRLGK